MAEEQFRVLVIEDDPDAALFTCTALERVGGMSTVLARTAAAGLQALSEATFDLVLSDIELPGESGLDILPEVHRLAPGVPVVMLTAHASVDYAVDALRAGVDEFLSKPIGVEALVDRVNTLASDGRERRARSPRARTVLAVGAHPDDVEIGVGAALGAHRAAGDEIVILTLSGGGVGGDTAARQAEARAAAAIVGARLIHLDFPDTRIDPADGVITAIEGVIAEVRPDQLYTHTAHDRHQDHRAVNEAVQVAARSIPNLACYQSPSSTVDFRPNRFVDVEGHLDTKLAMLAAFASQSHRGYMQPDIVLATCRYWSRYGVSRFVEPLEAIRSTVQLAPVVGPAGELSPEG
ncbi:MAG: response regulator [Propionicimonas sp.]|uniref:PIG-L deacetylase family protein n=1 Tax=Propionicimonas sp. TaxID=1955623 RepID=UPI003D134AFA